jgi:hypothetical protein
MISLKLLDFSPLFLLIFSPLGTADFFMLLELSGDGYSLLCRKKQPPRHSPGISIAGRNCLVISYITLYRFLSEELIFLDPIPNSKALFDRS